MTMGGVCPEINHGEEAVTHWANPRSGTLSFWAKRDTNGTTWAQARYKPFEIDSV